MTFNDKERTKLKQPCGPISKAHLGDLTLFHKLKLVLHHCHEYLLGVKANLCLHNSQYSFLLCFSHWTKL